MLNEDSDDDIFSIFWSPRITALFLEMSEHNFIFVEGFRIGRPPLQ